MDISEYISRFLGLKEVFIEKIDFFDSEFKIVITAKQSVDKKICCKCESLTTGIHSWQSRKVKAAPLGIYQTVIIKLSYPRSYCEVCSSVRTCRVSWINKRCPSLSCGLVRLLVVGWKRQHAKPHQDYLSTTQERFGGLISGECVRCCMSLNCLRILIAHIYQQMRYTTEI